MKFINNLLKEGPVYGPVVTRLGLAAVFLWFGISQFTDPTYFAGYVPSYLSDYASQLVFANAVFETVLGLALLVGVFTRPAALLLGIHLLGITIEIGYNELGVRDFGLALATLGIFLMGPDKYCWDSKKKK